MEQIEIALEETWKLRLRKHKNLGFYDDLTETVISPVGFRDTKGEEKRPSTIQLHELLHHAQKIGTPYGSFISLLDEETNKYQRLFIADLYGSKIAPPYYFPLGEWIPNLIRKNQIPLETINRYYTWNHLIRIKKAIEGVSNYNLDKLFISIIVSNETVLGSIPLPLIKGPDEAGLEKYGQESSPVFNSSPIGASHILESLSWLHENFTDRTSNVPTVTRDVVLDELGSKTKYNSIYQSAYILYLLSIGFDENKLQEFLELCLDEPLTLYSNSITFVAIAHLALISPMGLFSRLMPQATWHDVHPGWRFVRICEQIKQRKSNLLVHLDFNNYEDVQATICDWFNWPKPVEFREVAKKAVNSPQLQKDLTLTPESPKSDHLLYRTLHAILEIEKYPWAYVFPTPEIPQNFFSTVLKLYRPAWIQTNKFMIIPAWYTTDKNIEFNMFKNSFDIYDLPTIFGQTSSKISDDFYKAHFTLLYYLSGCWNDYIMTNSLSDIDNFLSDIFPDDMNIHNTNHFLTFLLLDVNALMYYYCEMRDFKDL